jgi:hypothetical protein
MLYKLSRDNAPRAGKKRGTYRTTPYTVAVVFHAWKLHYYKDLTLKRVYLFLFNLIE